MFVSLSANQRRRISNSLQSSAIFRSCIIHSDETTIATQYFICKVGISRTNQQKYNRHTRGFQDPMSQTSTISHQTTGHATYRTLPSLVRIMIRVSSAAISRRKYITLTLSGVHYNQSNNRLGSISSYSSVAQLCLQKLMSTPSRITTNLADNDSLPSSLSSYSSCN